MVSTIPIAFEAAILERNNQPLVIDQVAFNGPLLTGQVLVRVHYSGICGKQIEEVIGAGGPDPFLPHMLGHEGSGVVVETGPGVTKAAVGDNVILHWMKGLGIDAVTPLYERNGERVNAGRVTTFNRYAVVSENRITPVPADTDMRTACLLGCGVSTGLGVVINEADIRPGQAVAVVGCGGVGLVILQASRLRHAHPIIAIDKDPGKLALAREFGATHGVLSTTDDVAQRVREFTDGTGAEVVFVAAGSASAVETGAVAGGMPSTIFLVGVPPKGSTVMLDAWSIHMKKTFTGSFGGGVLPDRDIPSYLGLQRAGTLDLDKLVDFEVPLSQINEGIEQLREGRASGRIIVNLLE